MGSEKRNLCLMRWGLGVLLFCLCAVQSILFSETQAAEAYVDNLAGEYCFISAMNPERALSAENGETEDGTNVESGKLNNTTAQIFRLKRIKDGWYQIINKKSGKVLDVDNGEKRSGVNVLLWYSHGEYNQLWRFIPAGDGNYYIKSKQGYYLTIKGGSSAAGANVVVASLKKASYQKWRLVKRATKGNSVIKNIGSLSGSDDTCKLYRFSGQSFSGDYGYHNKAAITLPNKKNYYMKFNMKKTGYFSITTFGVVDSEGVGNTRIDFEVLNSAKKSVDPYKLKKAKRAAIGNPDMGYVYYLKKGTYYLHVKNPRFSGYTYRNILPQGFMVDIRVYYGYPDTNTKKTAKKMQIGKKYSFLLPLNSKKKARSWFSFSTNGEKPIELVQTTRRLSGQFEAFIYGPQFPGGVPLTIKGSKRNYLNGDGYEEGVDDPVGKGSGLLGRVDKNTGKTVGLVPGRYYICIQKKQASTNSLKSFISGEIMIKN